MSNSNKRKDPPSDSEVEEEEEENYTIYDHAIALLNVVYSEAGTDDFPMPLETYEAGPCLDGQRRYLWTDAIAVMAYQTLVEHYMGNGDLESARLYRTAVEQLIAAVHNSLGRPRSNRKSDAMKECDISPTGYVGLRIGKPTAKKVTDLANRYDGMFWHHITMWLFALARANHIDEAIRIAKSCFPSFFQRQTRFSNGGMHYKLSVDGTPPPTDGYSYYGDCYDDTINALVVFSILEAKNQRSGEISLQTEIGQLRGILQTFNTETFAPPHEKPHLRAERSHDDSQFWWFMEAVFDQFVVEPYRTNNYHFKERVHCLGRIQIYHSRPWYAYAELIGASVNGTLMPDEDLDDLVKGWIYRQPVRYQFMGGHPQEADRKAGMARVMHAMALLHPGVLKRRVDDVMVRI